jgi:predicted ATP-dependent endonuclease of OLD family
MKITKIEIKRFRSINNLTLDLKQDKNLVTICGQNNVGKTNVFRALNLFFNKTDFNYKLDCPEFKQMTGGAAVYPLIKINFKDKNSNFWEISKDFNPKKIEDDSVNEYLLFGKKNNIELTLNELEKFFSNLHFFFLPSINISFPEIINYVVDDQFLDIEFGKSKMRGKKAEVKNSLEKAKTTLQSILDDLTDSINPTFKDFHESWGIKFDVPVSVNRFRELINEEINFLLIDDTNTQINTKGSGLQRLGHILMIFRVVEKLVEAKKNCIVLIDEPDIYLHYKLQKSLFKKINELSKLTQVFITTHSPIFINPYNLDNLFLLELTVEEKMSVRKGKTGKVLSTSKLDIEKVDSVSIVKDILGIDDSDTFLIGNYNLIVEGNEDKKYLEELINVFELPKPNIISANGATNILKLLDYYNAMSDTQEEIIRFKVLFDNDSAGREEFLKVDKKVKKDNFNNLKIECCFIIDAFNTKFTKDKPNIEIEDFIYPEMILDLANKIFKKKKGFRKILSTSFMKKIENPSMRYLGILDILESLKNERNPIDGISFSTKEQGFKGGLSNNFNLKGDSASIESVKLYDKKYPEVKKFLVSLVSF